MSACTIPIQEILDSECIGESLPKINTNFLELSSSICSLSSTLVQAFDGTVKSIGVEGGFTGLTTLNSPVTGTGTITLEGILNLAHGGTGVNASDIAGKAQARENLGIGTISTFNSPLSIEHGGTGATSATQARTNLGLENANLITVGQIKIENGGTGAQTAAQARLNLGTNDAANINTGLLGLEYGGLGVNIATTAGKTQARLTLGLGDIAVRNSPLGVQFGGTGTNTVTTKTFFAGPISSDGSPSFREIDPRDIPLLPATKIAPNSGVLPTSVIPVLPAGNIGSGILNESQIPNLPATKITSGILSTAIGGTGSNIVSTNLIFAGPPNGAPALPQFRQIVSQDIPQKLQIESLGVGRPASNIIGQINTTGNIQAAGDVIAFFSSDERLKENIKPIENALEKVSKISGVTFDWTKSYLEQNGGADGYFVRKNDVGVIAQEVKEILPEVVAQRQDGMLAVKYDRICVLLIQAIKELLKKHENLIEVGTIQTFIHKTAPQGWLICNGDKIPNGNGVVQDQVADYSVLYNLLEKLGYTNGVLPTFQKEEMIYCIKY